MKRITLYFTCILVTLTLMACEDPNDAKNNQFVVERTAVLIFPDATASIGNTAFDSLSMNLDRLLRSIPYDSRVEVIPIGASRNPSSARHLTFPAQTRVALKTECKETCSSKRKSVDAWISGQRSVLAEIRSQYQASVQIERSCLLNAFERVQTRGLSLLNSNETHMSGGGFDRIEAIFLTDMVEECEDTLVGAVDLPRAEEEAEQKRTDWLQERDWSVLRHPKVQFHFLEQEPTGRIRASVPNPSTFWRPFLENFGPEGEKWLLDQKVQDVIRTFRQRGLPATTPCDQICR